MNGYKFRVFQALSIRGAFLTILAVVLTVAMLSAFSRSISRPFSAFASTPVHVNSRRPSRGDSIRTLGNKDSRDSGEMSNVAGPPPVVVKASGKQTASVIFFHGLGDQGHGWAQMFEADVKLPQVKGIFPNAADRPVSLNYGMVMPAWYDLFGLTIDCKEDAEGIQRATKYAHELINAEIKAGIPSERIVIGGFSMGGALAIYAGLTFDKPLGGIIGLSSFLLQRKTLPGNHTANLKTPIFLGHGTEDPLVPFQFGKMTSDEISKFNQKVELKSYRMGHTSSPAEIVDVRAFLAKNLA